MPKVDLYSITSKSSADEINAYALPEDEAETVSTGIETNSDLSQVKGLDEAFLLSAMEATPETRFALGQLAQQNYSSFYKEELSPFARVTQGVSSAAVGVLETAGDVIINTVGLGIGFASGEFEDAEEAKAGLGAAFGEGTTLGQLLKGTYDYVANGDASAWEGFGTSWYIDDESAIAERKRESLQKVFGWDTIDEYGHRPSIGAAVAGQAMRLDQDSDAYRWVEGTANLASLAAYLVTGSGLIKGAMKKVFNTVAPTAAKAEAAQVGLVIEEAVKAQDELLKLQDEVFVNTVDEALDVIDDVPEAAEALRNTGKNVVDDFNTNAAGESVQSNVDSIATETGEILTEVAKLERIDAALEAAKVNNEGKAFRSTTAQNQAIAEIDAEIETIKKQIVSAGYSDETGAIPQEAMPEIAAGVSQRLARIEELQAQKELIKQGVVDVDEFGNVTEAVGTGTTPAPEAPRVYDEEWKGQYSGDIIKDPKKLNQIKTKNLSPETLRAFATHLDERSKNLSSTEKTILDNLELELVKNPNTPIDVLEKLSNSPNFMIRSAAAQHPNITNELLIKMADDKFGMVWARVAENPNAPTEALDKLAKSSDINKRLAVAKNPNTSSKALAKLAEDNSDEIKILVAKNPNTSSETLVKLLDNVDENIRTAAYYNPNIDDTVRQSRKEMIEAMDSETWAKQSNLSIKFSNEAEEAFQKARAEMRGATTADETVAAVDEVTAAMPASKPADFNVEIKKDKAVRGKQKSGATNLTWKDEVSRLLYIVRNKKVAAKNQEAVFARLQTIFPKMTREELSALGDKVAAFIKSNKKGADNFEVDTIDEVTQAVVNSGTRAAERNIEQVNAVAAANVSDIKKIEQAQAVVRNRKEVLNQKAKKIAEDFAKKNNIELANPITNYEDASEFIKDVIGLRKGVDTTRVLNIDKYLKWLFGKNFDGVLDSILAYNKASQAAEAAGQAASSYGQIRTILRAAVPHEYVLLMSRAATKDELRAIFAKGISQGFFAERSIYYRYLRWNSRLMDPNTGTYRTIDSYDNAYQKAMATVGITANKFIIKSLEKKAAQIPTMRAYHLDNPEEMVDGLSDMMDFWFTAMRWKIKGRDGKAVRDFKYRYVTKMANATTSEARRVIWYEAQEEVIRLYAKMFKYSEENVNGMIKAFRNARENSDITSAKIAELNLQVPGGRLMPLLSDAEKTAYNMIMYEMHMSHTVSMINPLAMRAMLREGKVLDSADALKRFKVGSAEYKEALLATQEQLNKLFDTTFKRLVLLRFGYVVRNTMEANVRMFLKGHPSMFSNPYFLISHLAFGDGSRKGFIQNTVGRLAQKVMSEEQIAGLRQWLVKRSRVSADVKGNAWNVMDEVVFKVIDELEADITKLEKQEAKLEKAFANAADPEEAQKIATQLEELRATKNDLIDQLDEVSARAAVEQEAADFVSNSWDLGEVLNPGEGYAGTAWARQGINYAQIGLQDSNFLKAVAEYVRRIASDDMAKDVLTVLSGRGLPKHIKEWARKNNLMNRPIEEILVDYYWAGPGRTRIQKLQEIEARYNKEALKRSQQRGEEPPQPSDSYSSRDKIKEYLLGDADPRSHYSILRAFTNNFEAKFVNAILYNRIEITSKSGQTIVKKYPVKNGDPDANVRMRYKGMIADYENLYNDLVKTWKENPATSPVRNIPFAQGGATVLDRFQRSNIFNLFSDTIYDWSARAQKTFASVPEFKYSHWDYVADNIAALSPEEAAEVIKTAEKVLSVRKNGKVLYGWSRDVLKKMKKNAKLATKNSNYGIDNLRTAANNYAADQVSKLFYDAQKRNALGHELRFIWPFIQAHANTMLTWTKYAIKNPQQIYKFQVINQYLNSEDSSFLNMLLGTDYYDIHQSYIFQDPQTGQDKFAIPLVSNITAFFGNVAGFVSGQGWLGITGENIAATGDVGSLNLFAQNGLIPGSGPALTIPLNVISRMSPAVYNMIPDSVKEAIAPYGFDASAALTFESAFLPAWMQDAIAFIMFPERRDKFMSAAITILLQTNPEKYTDGFGNITENGMPLLVDDARAISGGLAFGRGIWGIFTPVSTKFEATYTVEELGETYVQSIIAGEFYALMSNGMDQSEALVEMANRYGKEVTILLASTSKSGFVPSGDAWQALKNNPDLLAEDGAVFAGFFPGGGYSYFLAGVMENGENTSWEDYVKSINDVGFALEESELDRKFVAGEISEQEYEDSLSMLKERRNNVPTPSVSPYDRNMTINGLRDALRNPILANTEAGQATLFYMTERDNILRQIGATQISDAARNTEYRMQLFDLGQALAAQYPDFAVFWFKVFRKEVKPQEEGV